jgi:fumarylacetoacetate (FAA) hydrolase
MKLVSYLNGGREQVGLLLYDEVFTLQSLHPIIPATMGGLLENWEFFIGLAQTAERLLKTNPLMQQAGVPLKAVELLAPVPHPTSLRDGYAFRQHVETARRNRGLSMTPAFDEFPVFYFGNHRSVVGPGTIVCMDDHLEELDYELEVAALISKPGKNIRAADADQYIGGLMILNDFSARQLQMEEMQLSLGPAKGKDFATATGPWLVTLDELEPHRCIAPPGHVGSCWDLNMIARIDGGLLSAGNLSDMHWTFAELIERASYGVDLYPGDIIGSGTVGTGCFLELNGTNKLMDPDYMPQWLQAGETVELEVECLGVLRNRIEWADDDHSLLSLKKKLHDHSG